MKFSYSLLSLVNEKWSFNFGMVIRQKISAKNLYPPKGSAKAHPMGSNWFSYSLLSLVNEKWSFNFELVIRQKISAKNLYCADGRMDGRMDGWTVIKSVLRFSLFWCIQKWGKLKDPNCLPSTLHPPPTTHRHNKSFWPKFLGGLPAQK